MKVGWYTRVLLTVIAVSLAVLATQPFLVPPQSYAARPIEYRLLPVILQTSRSDVRKELVEEGQAGWDIAVVFSQRGDQVIVLKR